MRHRLSKRKLGRTTSHRLAMLRNMVTSFFEHERIKTTVEKAKELSSLAEKMITYAKKGDLSSRRQCLKVIRKKQVVTKLFNEIAPCCQERKGGYTRIIRIGRRAGDNAQMCFIELIDMTKEKKEKEDKKEKENKG